VHANPFIVSLAGVAGSPRRNAGSFAIGHLSPPPEDLALIDWTTHAGKVWFRYYCTHPDGSVLAVARCQLPGSSHIEFRAIKIGQEAAGNPHYTD
jgi:hypothetical protein